MRIACFSRILYRSALTAFTAVFLVMMFTPLATIAADDSTKPYIEGYSPVSYFTENRAELGRPEFSVRHRGRTYWLTSKQQVTLFEQDPDKYRPRYDLCPYSLALGKHLPLDPKNFKIVGGSLLLFHRSDQNDGLRGFQQSGLSGEELIRRADANYTLFRFD